MAIRMKAALSSSPFAPGSIPLPRLWVVLLVGAVPLLMVCADCLETLERSGRSGAIVANSLLSAGIVAYLVLLVWLKQKKL